MQDFVTKEHLFFLVEHGNNYVEPLLENVLQYASIPVAVGAGFAANRHLENKRKEQEVMQKAQSKKKNLKRVGLALAGAALYATGKHQGNQKGQSTGINIAKETINNLLHSPSMDMDTFQRALDTKEPKPHSLLHKLHKTVKNTINTSTRTSGETMKVKPPSAEEVASWTGEIKPKK